MAMLCSTRAIETHRADVVFRCCIRRGYGRTIVSVTAARDCHTKKRSPLPSIAKPVPRSVAWPFCSRTFSGLMSRWMIQDRACSRGRRRLRAR